MAIRIRKINGKIVALCAAKNKYKKGDIYLNDTIDHALRIKFLKDHKEEGYVRLRRRRARFKPVDTPDM